ncbi:MAG TPA: hypothetical protein VLI43_08895 [Gemmatimonadaceae bacterium]|nr:hypothetical protein [Gemmatimonadaceae bacterium]
MGIASRKNYISMYGLRKQVAELGVDLAGAAESDALGKESQKFSPFMSVSVHLCRSIQVFPARLARPSPLREESLGAGKGNCEDRHKRTRTDKSKTGRRMLNQPVFSRSAPGSFDPIAHAIFGVAFTD